MNDLPKLYYFADPMCSWCWAFSPIINKLRIEYTELETVLIMGGLRGGAEQAMDDQFAERTKRIWQTITAATGQSFNFDFWDEHRPLQTTYTACKAVIAAKIQDETKTWEYMNGMLKAFYQRALDPTQLATQVQIATEVGLVADDFKQILASEATDAAFNADLKSAETFGVSGFPSLWLRTNQETYPVSLGYQGYNEVVQSLENIGQQADLPQLSAGCRILS